MTAADPALRSLLWRWLGRHLHWLSLHNGYRFRNRLLGWHGATIGANTKFRRTVRVDRPWNLTTGELAAIGDDVELRASAPLRIGARAVVSQRCVVTTRCRDPHDPGFAPRTAPIDIGDDAWVATDSIVLPGARIGPGVVVGARSVVEGDLPAWRVATGDPATPRRDRPWHGPHRGEPDGASTSNGPDDENGRGPGADRSS